MCICANVSTYFISLGLSFSLSIHLSIPERCMVSEILAPNYEREDVGTLEGRQKFDKKY